MKQTFKAKVVLIFILLFFGLSGWHNDVHGRTGVVQLDGYALNDDNGTFLGLGATYFLALRHEKYNENLLISNLAFLSDQGFNYIRILSMVGEYDIWRGQEIIPINCDYGDAWDDYWDQFRALVDRVYNYGMRTQITIFADANGMMPNLSNRQEHIERIISEVVKDREEKIILIEVANEFSWNGLSLSELQDYGNYLASENYGTSVLVALSAPEGGKIGICNVYNNVDGVDIATVHFSRDNDPTKPHRGWLPVYDCEDVYSYTCSLPIKVSSNEPIGLRLGDDQELKANEKDPMKLVMAAAYAWHSKLPMYVFHSTPGVANPNNKTFEEFLSDCEGEFGHNYLNIFKNVKEFLPPDLPNWQTFDCQQVSAPFKCVTNIERCPSSVNGDDFYAFPIMVVDGAQIEAQRTIYSLEVYNPLDLYDASGNPKPLTGFPDHLNIGDTLTFPSGSEDAYILKGKVDDKYINVLQANGGEQWEIGGTYSIQWDSYGDIGNVSIHLYKNNIYQQSIAEDIANTGTFSWNIPGATTPGSDYKIYVKSSLYEYLEDFSDTFFTIGSLPSAPVLVWPLNEVNIETRKPVFDWDAVTAFPAVTNYEIKILDETQTIIIHTATIGNQSQYQIPYEMDCNTLFYWQVRARNDVGWGSWSNPVFFETPENPEIVVTIGPKNYQFVNTLTPTLSWYPADSVIPVTDYQIRVFDSSGNIIYGPISVGNVTSYQLPSGLLSFDRTYYWEVRAYNACSWSEWSSPPAYFKTPQIPYAPTIIYPKGGTVTPRTVTLQWTPVDVYPSVDKYHIEVRRASDNSLIREKYPTGSSTTVTLPGNTTYKWRVRAHNSKGWGPWSAYKNFKTN